MTDEVVKIDIGSHVFELEDENGCVAVQVYDFDGNPIDRVVSGTEFAAKTARVSFAMLVIDAVLAAEDNVAGLDLDALEGVDILSDDWRLRHKQGSYSVTWQIDVEAHTPAEAAVIAAMHMMKVTAGRSDDRAFSVGDGSLEWVLYVPFNPALPVEVRGVFNP